MKYKNTAIKVIDLFSGCGGLNEGFKKAGFKTSVSNDIWEPAGKTFSRNNKDSKFILGDITQKKIRDDIIRYGKDSDVLIGGPPCQAYSNLLMICVLLPFWTSLLVRTVAWMIILQQKGVFNNLMVMAGLIADENRWKLMYNETGTIIVMTQILLPFMVLPLYSVMKTISPSYMKAALNLGASPLHAFWKVYMPNSIPGISAGGLLVFIIAIGYFITPELVGGKDGQMIGNWIAYHLKTTLNWGLCAALGSVLLAVMLVFYWLYNKIIGVENIKLG